MSHSGTINNALFTFFQIKHARNVSAHTNEWPGKDVSVFVYFMLLCLSRLISCAFPSLGCSPVFLHVIMTKKQLIGRAEGYKYSFQNQQGKRSNFCFNRSHSKNCWVKNNPIWVNDLGHFDPAPTIVFCFVFFSKQTIQNWVKLTQVAGRSNL